MRASGSVWTPLIILVISMVVIRVPFAIMLQPHFGADAIWWSFPLGTITSAALTGLYYRFGGWRKLRMLSLDDSDDGALMPGPAQGRPGGPVAAASTGVAR